MNSPQQTGAPGGLSAAQRPAVSALATASGGARTTSRPSGDAQPAYFSAFIPMLLIGIAFLSFVWFQTLGLMRARETLQAAIRGQYGALAQARQVRTALNHIADGTQRLADGGDAGAQLIVAQLRKRGITIRLPASGGVSTP